MAGRMAASNDFFLATCSTLLERMVNTVPKGVQLSAPIDPIYVKPDGFDMVVNTDSTITIDGTLRVCILSQVSNCADLRRLPRPPMDGHLLFFTSSLALAPSTLV